MRGDVGRMGPEKTHGEEKRPAAVGRAAVSLPLRHGDTFGAAASWDAPLMFTEKQFGIWKTDKQYGTPAAMAAHLNRDAFFSCLLGSP